MADAAALTMALTSSGVSVCATPPREVCDARRTDDSCRTETTMPASPASVALARARSRQDRFAGRVVVIGMDANYTELCSRASQSRSIGIDGQDLDFARAPANLSLAKRRRCDRRLQPIV